MARAGLRGVAELFLRSVAGDTTYEALEQDLRDRLLRETHVEAGAQPGGQAENRVPVDRVRRRNVLLHVDLAGNPHSNPRSPVHLRAALDPTRRRRQDQQPRRRIALAAVTERVYRLRSARSWRKATPR
jgi:hypothetical protein